PRDTLWHVARLLSNQIPTVHATSSSMECPIPHELAHPRSDCSAAMMRPALLCAMLSMLQIVRSQSNALPRLGSYQHKMGIVPVSLLQLCDLQKIKQCLPLPQNWPFLLWFLQRFLHLWHSFLIYLRRSPKTFHVLN